MDIATLVPTIVYGSILLFILGAIATLWNRMGNIQRDIGHLEANVANTQTSLNEKTEALQTSLNEKTGALQTSLNEKTEALQTSLNEKTGALQTSLNEKTGALQSSLNEKTGALQTSLNDLRDTVAQMQLQMQRNHYQLMMAILAHSHGPDGRPTFDLPPDFESSPTDE
jgi:DNA anti-recombination protein RmuC